MNYTLAVFKSRFATLNFANLLKKYGIPSAVINTPQNIMHACGLSVKFLNEYMFQVKKILGATELSSNFVGFFGYKHF